MRSLYLQLWYHFFKGCFLLNTLPERVADLSVAGDLSIPPQRGSYAAALTADCDKYQCSIGRRKRTVECLKELIKSCYAVSDRIFCHGL